MSLRDAISLQLATVYAELNDLAALDVPGDRVRGSFAVKTIAGRRYWYRQYWQGKRRVQTSLGPETPDLLARIAALRADNAARRREQARRRELTRAVKAGLNMPKAGLSGRVIAQLADKGFFDAGTILIGTHAYIAYAAMLGRPLAQANLQTSDIDVAVVDIAADLPLSFPDAVASVDDAFFEVPPRPGARLSTALKYRGDDTRVELLTPHRGGEPWSPVAIPALRFGAQQAPFLDYLIEGPVAATYLYDGGVRVRVPHPARYALHKLIVAVERDVSAQAKSVKDMAQAAELIAVLSEDRPDDLRDAADALAAHGGHYLGKARSGAARLPAEIRCRLPPELQG